MKESREQENLPGRHTIAVFTFVILVPLVYFIPSWLTRNVTDNHFFVTVIALAIIVPIISYIALPLLFRSVKLLSEKK